MDYTTNIANYIQDLNKTLNNVNFNSINKFLDLMKEASCNRRKIYVCGNGGSASTASHFAGDYNKGLKEYNFDFTCLSDNLPAMMAIANDIGYDDIFKYQLINKVNSGDIIIGISGSGNSKNIIKALTYASECGAITVGITGFDGGEIKKICDLSIHFPINDMQVAEDLHLIFNHMTMRILKEVNDNENFVY